MIEIRDYIGISTEPLPVVIVRQLSTGCAIPASLAAQMGIIAANQPISTTTWLNQSQITAHRQYADSITTTKCYPGMNPTGTGVWVRSPDWVPRNNGATAYVSAVLSAASIQTLLAGRAFLRIQFPLPTTPPTPCANAQCTRTGNEQVRYFSIEFDAGTSTITALDDQQLATDANGNVTLIVGMGGAPQPAATEAGTYTYLDLTQFTGYNQLTAVLIRDLLPNISFECSSFNVPFYTTEWNPEGGFMGRYVPTLDFPTASEIPPVPIPPVLPNSCYAIPPVQPQGCAVARNPV
jgi:hypothetical protein